MSINAHTKLFPITCTNLGISKSLKCEEKEDLKIMLKWGKLFFDVIVDRGISHAWKIRSSWFKYSTVISTFYLLIETIHQVMVSGDLLVLY